MDCHSCGGLVNLWAFQLFRIVGFDECIQHKIGVEIAQLCGFRSYAYIFQMTGDDWDWI
jgi:hypothetical protein